MKSIIICCAYYCIVRDLALLEGTSFFLCSIYLMLYHHTCVLDYVYAFLNACFHMHKSACRISTQFIVKGYTIF